MNYLQRHKNNFTFILLGLLWLVVTNSMYIRGYSLSTPTSQYTGVNSISAADKFVYYSMITQGEQGHLWMKNLHTSEPQEGRLFSPHWYLLGQVVRLTHWPIDVVYQLGRIILQLLFLVVLWFWIRRLWTGIFEQMLAWVVVLFSLGFGWWLIWYQPGVMADVQRAFLAVPIDVYMTEVFAFSTASQSPLFILSHCLILGIFYLLVAKKDLFSWKWDSLCGLLLFLLITTHPYDAVIIISVATTWIAWLWYEGSLILKKKIIYLALWIAVATAVVAYSFYSQVALSGWASQNLVYSPRIENYLIGFGLLIPLWFVGIWVLRKTQSSWWRLLWLWSLLGWILIYLPTTINRRFANAWGIAIALIAAQGIVVLVRKIPSYWLRAAAVIFTFLFLFMGTVLSTVYQWSAFPGLREYSRFYMPPDTQSMLTFIKQRTGAAAVVMVEDEDLALFVPAYTGRIVFVGHHHQTANYPQKQQQQDEFFSRDTGMNRREFLASNNITFVLTNDQHEWLSHYEYLELKESIGRWRLYQVK